jgi:hypothetical protein
MALMENPADNIISNILPVCPSAKASGLIMVKVVLLIYSSLGEFWCKGIFILRELACPCHNTQVPVP